MPLFQAIMGLSTDEIDALVQELVTTTDYVGDVRPWQATPETAEDSDDDISAEEALEVWKWEESKHPRDKEGQFTNALGTLRQPGEEKGPGIEGGGPERLKWEKLNTVLMDVTDTYIDLKRAHTELFVKPIEKQINEAFEKNATADELAFLETKLYQTPEYRASKQKVDEAERLVNEAGVALVLQGPAMRIEVATSHTTQVARQMGIDPSVIHIVDKEPTPFEVGSKHFTEAGHFSPTTGEVEINARNLYSRTQDIKGTTAHELSHLEYHALKEAAEKEGEIFKQKSNYYEDFPTQWFNENFTRPGPYGHVTVRPEKKAEIEKEFPASAVWAKLADNGEMFTGIGQDMINENGHSAYARSYWTREAINSRGGTYDPAINESVAELTRYMAYPSSWHEHTTPQPSSPWVQFTIAMQKWYTENKVTIEADAQEKAKLQAEEKRLNDARRAEFKRLAEEAAAKGRAAREAAKAAKAKKVT